MDTITINRDARLAVRAHPGPLSTLRVFHSESGMHGGFVWERRALNRTKRRLPARAVAWSQPAAHKTAINACCLLPGKLRGLIATGDDDGTVKLGLGRIVALYCRSSTLYHIH